MSIQRTGTYISPTTTGINASTIDSTSTALESSAIVVSGYDHVYFNVGCYVGDVDDDLSIEIQASELSTGWGTYLGPIIVDTSAGGNIYTPIVLHQPPPFLKFKFLKIQDTGTAHTIIVSGVGFLYTNV